mmetsp:Transcript_3028/g.6735  ORF Transcript_3028/g.6735 Transcript_3028/m.6735 type:complete len:83 (+) Transcript_3028:1200-1448(+)
MILSKDLAYEVVLEVHQHGYEVPVSRENMPLNIFVIFLTTAWSFVDFGALAAEASTPAFEKTSGLACISSKTVVRQILLTLF